MENPLSACSHTHTQREITDICTYAFTCTCLIYADSHFKTNFNLFDSTTEFRAEWQSSNFFLSASLCVFLISCFSPLGKLIEKRPLCSEVSNDVGVVIHFFIFNPKATIVPLVTQRLIRHIYAARMGFFLGFFCGVKLVQPVLIRKRWLLYRPHHIY